MLTDTQKKRDIVKVKLYADYLRILKENPEKGVSNAITESGKLYGKSYFSARKYIKEVKLHIDYYSNLL